MGKGKSKKKEPTPEPDTVILYIENPVGIYGAKDWYKNTQALGIVSTWLYMLTDAGGLSRPSSLWYRGGVGSSYLLDIVVDLYVPESDASKVDYALGYHYWKDFVRLSPRMERDLMLPQDEESRMTTVYRSPCRSTIKLDSDQFLKIPLIPPNKANFRDFAPGPYPVPTLPYVPNLKTTYKEPLPTRPPPPPSPPPPQPVEFSQPPEGEDQETKKKKAILASTVQPEGRSTPVLSVTKQEETFSRTKEEQLEYEMGRLAQNGHLTSPPLQETKPNITPTPTTKEEQLEYEMGSLAQNRHLTSPPPPQETKPNITPTPITKQEQLEYELSHLAQDRHLTSPPPPQETKPNLTPSATTKQEQLEHELSRLTQSDGLAPPEPPQHETKPNVKEEQLLLEMELLAANSGTVLPEHGRGTTMAPDPEAARPIQAKQEPFTAADENEAMRRRVKEELLELEMARLAQSSSSTPAPATVKPEPGLPRSLPPDPRRTAGSAVGPLESNPRMVIKPEPGSLTETPRSTGRSSAEGSPLAAVKPEPGTSTPNPLKRSRDGQNQPAEYSAGKRFKQEGQY